VDAIRVVAVAACIHLRDDLGIVLRGERVARLGEDLVLAVDMGAMGQGEPGGGIEQGLAGAGPGFTVELARERCDLGVQRDLDRVLGRELGELAGELWPPGRQPREHRTILIDEVPGHRVFEVGHRAVHAVEVGAIGAPCRQTPRRIQELDNHLVVAAVEALEFREACKLHRLLGIHAGPRCTSAGRR
jgi:hypothetical protein